uniref:tRNA (uracil(54)-C(5))-methyltransferase n=1 Tax=Scylla olivacea TaxID=85551 RepID=A0A0P4WEC3_SCYOL
MGVTSMCCLASRVWVRHLKTQAACQLPRGSYFRPEGKASAKIVVPLAEENLLKIAGNSSRQTQLLEITKESHSRKTEPKSIGLKEKGKKATPPLLPPVTEDTQFQRLAESVTPLCEVPYSKQLVIKEQECKKVLKELGNRLSKAGMPLQRNFKKLPCVLEPTRPSPELIGYRNKDEFGIHFGVDGNPKTVGFFVGRPLDPEMVCVPPTFLINMREKHKQIAQSFQKFIRQSPHEACHRFDKGGVWRNLVVRSTATGEKMASVIIHPQQLPEDTIQEIMEELRQYFINGEGSECELDSLYLQACPHTRCTREQAPYRLVAGKECITETCLDLYFQISPDSFFQINTKGAEVLYSTVKEIAEVSPVTTLLDICCGTGTVSLAMAPHVRGTIGIDITTGAVEDAKKNAALNNINNTIFIAGRAEKVLPRLTDELAQCSDVVAVVNPARAGLHPQVIRTIRKCEAIQKLIYVTCKPDGFAMENFVKLGSKKIKSPKARNTIPFIPKYAVPVDLFPHTCHNELVMLFERAKV